VTGQIARTYTGLADAFPDETIRFVGLYDPVGSVGLPGCFMNYRSQLPSGVQHAAEAIAFDEDRTFFPWTNVVGAEQKWFRGTHSDIGGGWADHRLSDVALQWMMSQASVAGLTLNLSQTLAQTYQGQRLTFTPDPNAPINRNPWYWPKALGVLDRAMGAFFYSDWIERGVPINAMGLYNDMVTEFAFSFSFSLGF
jgi:hypothetical protein